MLVGRTELTQSRRPALFTHFDQYDDVEPQLASHIQYCLQCSKINRVLALVVCRAAAVPALTNPGDAPGVHIIDPLAALAG